MSSTFLPYASMPWVRIAAVGGIAWNAYGLLQLANAVTATEQSLIESGLTPEQALIMTSYPAWMTLAFVVGVVGGLAGSLLLLFRGGLAKSVLAMSLAAYVALWIGDALHGVFAALGMPQVVVLTLVVAIAAGLWAVARAADTARQA